MTEQSYEDVQKATANSAADSGSAWESESAYETSSKNFKLGGDDAGVIKDSGDAISITSTPSKLVPV